MRRNGSCACLRRLTALVGLRPAVPWCRKRLNLAFPARQLLFGNGRGAYRIIFHIREEEQRVAVLRILACFAGRHQRRGCRALISSVSIGLLQLTVSSSTDPRSLKTGYHKQSALWFRLPSFPCSKMRALGRVSVCWWGAAWLSPGTWVRAGCCGMQSLEPLALLAGCWRRHSSRMRTAPQFARVTLSCGQRPFITSIRTS
jgi:hypothetical protein